MQTTFSRNEKLIALIAFIAIIVFFVTFLMINRTGSAGSQIEIRSGINYQMARPQSSYSEYSLSGRDIDQVYEALQKSTQQKKHIQTKPASAVTSSKKTDVKAKSEAQLKSTQQALQIQQQKTEALQKQTAQKSKQLKEASTKNESDGSHSEASNQIQNVPARENVNNNNEVKADETTTKKKKTFAEWRALLFSQPTHETLNLLIEAHKKNEVTAAEYQALAQDLLDQNDDKLKGLGLYALRSNPSLASFSQLVHIESELPATYKTYVEQAYISYLMPQNMGYLNQALQTKDKTLILKSLNLLGFNLHKIAQGDTAAFIDPRNRRDVNAASQVSVGQFKSLLPALTALSASPDQDLSPLAQQIVSYIQSTNTIAVN